jgi:hypothetical protein
MAPDRGAPASPLPLSRLISLADQSAPLVGRIEASVSQRAGLAALLGLEDLADLSFNYRLAPIASERFRLTGEVEARVTQLCVVTLDPVAEHIQESIAVECWPEEQIESADEAEIDDLATSELPDDPPVPIVNGKVDLGVFAAEILASALNPYPRKEDVEFNWEDPAAPDRAASGPLAGLAKWKKPS